MHWHDEVVEWRPPGPLAFDVLMRYLAAPGWSGLTPAAKRSVATAAKAYAGSYRKAAAWLGVTVATIARALDPAISERHRTRNRTRYRTTPERERRKNLREQREAEAIKRGLKVCPRCGRVERPRRAPKL